MNSIVNLQVLQKWNRYDDKFIPAVNISDNNKSTDLFNLPLTRSVINNPSTQADHKASFVTLRRSTFILQVNTSYI